MKKMLFFASFLFAAQASAQELPTNPDEIIVTSRKYEETIQTSPVSVTVFDEETLDARGAIRTADIPGIGQKAIIMSGDALLMSMRGQAQNIIDITTDSSVATYVDGIYVARGYGLNTTLLDVENVQVLYGPQGTVFGRNSTGGAVLFKTNDPVLREFQFNGQVDYNKDNEPSFNLVTNVPLSENLSVRFAGLYEEENPAAFDRITGIGYEARNTSHGRMKLRYSPSDLDVIVAGEYYHSRGNTASRFMDYGFGQNAALAIENPGDTVAIDAGSFNRTEIYSISTNVDYSDFTFVGGYRRVQSDHRGDWDGTPLDLYRQEIVADVEQFNAEASYLGKLGPVTYNAGLFYFNETGNELGEAVFFGGFNHSRFLVDIDNSSYGAYLATYTNLNGSTRLNASVRYTRDEKNATTRNAALVRGVPVICLNGGVLTDNCSMAQSASFNKVTWSLGLDYFLTVDHMLYAKVGTGYKSGGNQNRSLTNENVSFDPENIIEFESGLKGKFGPVTYSVAGFYNEVDNYQILTVFQQPIVHTLIVNAAKTSSYGAELNTKISLLDNIIINGSAQFVHPKFVEYERNGVDLTGNRFNNVTRYQFTVDGTYTFKNITASASYTWRDATAQASQSREYLTAVYGETEANKIMRVTTIPTIGILNAQVTAEFGNMTLRVFGENLTNTRFRESNSFNEGLWNTSAWNDDRTYGVLIGYKF